MRRTMLAAAIGATLLGATPALAGSATGMRARSGALSHEATPATPATATTVTRTRAGITARLTYAGHYPKFRETLTISTHGRIAYRRAISQRRCEGVCGPLPGRASLRIVPLQRGGATPAVLLSFNTFGSDCCTIEQILYLHRNRWALATRNFGPVPARVARLRGDLYLIGGEKSFAARFGPMVAVALPIEVLRFSAGRFHDVTRRFPRLIARDAARWLAAFKLQARRGGPADGAAIAAWAADEDSLGHSRRVARYLAAQAALKHLDAGPGFGGDGKRFIARLDAFLRRRGYLR